jgi:hypothetical protein
MESLHFFLMNEKSIDIKFKEEEISMKNEK